NKGNPAVLSCVQLFENYRRTLSSIIKVTRPRQGQTKEVSMKLRQSILIAALVLFCAPPWMLSQDQTTSPTDPKPTTTQSGQTDQNTTSAPTDQTSMPPAVPQKDDAKIKHDGGRNDVDAIGNRKIGGRGMGNWYLLEGE